MRGKAQFCLLIIFVFCNSCFTSSSMLFAGNIVLQKDQSFASQVKTSNTVYEIHYVFDLEGDTVTLPDNCTLLFVGGRLKNGSVSWGANTELSGKYESSLSVFGRDVDFSSFIGTFDKKYETISIVMTNQGMRKALGSTSERLVLLKGSFFIADRIPVFASGMITNYPGYAPQIMCKGEQLETVISNGNGYIRYSLLSKEHPISGVYGLFDSECKPIHISRLSDVFNGEHPRAGDRVIKEDDQTLLVKIPMTDEVKRLIANKSSDFFKYSLLVLSGAFVDVTLQNLHTDANYIYGNARTRYFYDYSTYELTRYYGAFTKYDIFNLPIEGYGSFIDGNDIAHVSAEYKNPYLSTNSYGFIFDSNDRSLIFNGLHFIGGGTSVFMFLQNASNKTFTHCEFRDMHSTMVGNVNKNIVIDHCSFTNIFGQCISFGRGNGCIVESSCFKRIGTVMKTYYAVQNKGKNCKIANNRFEEFSCGAIFVGSETEFDSSALVEGNEIDNIGWMKDCENRCARDFGGIYVSSYASSIIIKNNIIRNICSQTCKDANSGQPLADGRGIFMDEGSNHVSVTGNVIYNVKFSYSIDSRNANTFVGHNSDNYFANNIIEGSCRIEGSPDVETITVICKNNIFDSRRPFKTNEYVRVEKDKNRYCAISVIGDVLHIPGKKSIKLSKRLNSIIKFERRN